MGATVLISVGKPAPMPLCDIFATMSEANEHAPAQDELQALRKIGFNDDVGLHGRTFHVQTEVTTRRGVVAKTTVLEGGIVRLTSSNPCPPSATEAQAAARAQHDDCKGQVERGELSL